MTALLVTAACLLLNLFVSHSALIQLDELEDSIIAIKPSEENPLMFEMDIRDLYPDLSEQGQKTRTFSASKA